MPNKRCSLIQMSVLVVLSFSLIFTGSVLNTIPLAAVTQTANNYVLIANPSNLTYSPGNTIAFSGRLTTLSGAPVSGVQIGIDDPIAMVCISATTNSSGNFTYNTTSKSYSKGVYAFTFYAGSTYAYAAIAVNPTSRYGLELTDSQDSQNTIVLGSSSSVSSFTTDLPVCIQPIPTGFPSATQTQINQTLDEITKFMANWKQNSLSDFDSNPVNGYVLGSAIGCTAVVVWTGYGVLACVPSYTFLLVSGSTSALNGFIVTAINNSNMTSSAKASWISSLNAANCFASVIGINHGSGLADFSSAGWTCGSVAGSVIKGALQLIANPSSSSSNQTSYGFVLIPKTVPTVSLQSPTTNGLSATVNGTATAHTSGAIISSMSFNWGDNATTTGFFPKTHVYAKAGTYTIKVTATDSNGLTGSASTKVTVPKTAPTVSLQPPTTNGLSATVNGTATATTSGATISSISFSWGDNATNTGLFPKTHDYAKAGTYTIKVTATDSNGLTGSASTKVTVTAPK